MNPEAAIREGQILTGPLFSEPMRVETVRADGADAWVAGLVGLRSEQFRRVTLRKADLAGPPANLPAAVRLNDLRIVPPASTKCNFLVLFPRNVEPHRDIADRGDVDWM